MKIKYTDNPRYGLLQIFPEDSIADDLINCEQLVTTFNTVPFFGVSTLLVISGGTVEEIAYFTGWLARHFTAIAIHTIGSQTCKVVFTLNSEYPIGKLIKLNKSDVNLP